MCELSSESTRTQQYWALPLVTECCHRKPSDTGGYGGNRVITRFIKLEEFIFFRKVLFLKGCELRGDAKGPRHKRRVYTTSPLLITTPWGPEK